MSDGQIVVAGILGVCVLAAIGGAIAAFVINRRDERREMERIIESNMRRTIGLDQKLPEDNQ